MKIIYLVRHGQSEGNLNDRVGHPDDLLSELGQAQAQFVAGRVGKFRVDALISSPYKRAHQTAEAIAADLKKPIEISDLFTEIKTPASIRGHHRSEEYVQDMYKRRNEYWGATEKLDDDEENFYDTNERVKQALQFLENHAGERIVVASHGLFIKMIIQYVILGEHLSPEISMRVYQRLAMGNTGITVLKFDDEQGWKVLSINDQTHLPKEHSSY